MLLCGKLLILLFLAGLQLKVFAQNTLSQSLGNQEPPKIFGNASTSYSSNFYNDTDPRKEQSTAFDATLNYSLKNSNILRLYTGGYKDLSDERQSQYYDTIFSWVNNSYWSSSSKLIFGQQVRLSLPTSKDSRVRDYKLFGVTVVPVMIFPLSNSFTFIYQPQLLKNFHTYQTNRQKKDNLEWSTNQLFVGSWSITDNWYFQPAVSFIRSWNYDGEARNSYQTSVELGRVMGKGFTLAAGWSNKRTLRRFEQGPDQNLEFFNKFTSVAYGAIYYLF